MEFSGKTVLVTGASRGIGRAIAEAFATCGARVAVHYHKNREAAEKTLAALSGASHTLVQGDVSDPEAARSIVEETVDRLGGLDILVNNAGIYEFHPIPESSYEEWLDAWQRTIGTNLLGPAHVMFWAVRQMVKGGGGRIVNISSRGAFRGEPQAPAYGASKAGLNSLSQSLAQALAPHGIYVTVLAPGWVETDMASDFLNGPSGEAIRNQSPLGRAARPEEMANTVLFLASERADYLTGCIVDANGASYLRS
jgi:3-oxoacyl-[acyl-carrier protein] reductase